jgi:hypothetical protein
MISPPPSANLPLFPQMGSFIPPSPVFTPPLVFSTYHPAIGRSLPIPANNPLLVQPAMNQDSGVLINSRLEVKEEQDDAEFLKAVNLINTDCEEAGRIFTDIRERRRDAHQKLVGTQDKLFVEAAFGSALWGKVTDQTFADLRQIRKKSKNLGDKETMFREMLIRSVAHSRICDNETAEGVLRRLLDGQDLASGSSGEGARIATLRCYAMIMYLNLLMNQAVRYTGEERSKALDKIYFEMKPFMSNLIAEMKAAKEIPQGLMGSLSKLYIFVAEFLLEQHRSLDAKEIVEEARALFPDTEAVGKVFNGETIAEDGPASHEISPLQQLMARETGGTVFSHFRAAAVEFLLRAQFPNNKAFWKTAVAGAMLGAGLVSGTQIMGGHEAMFPDAMIGSSIGAVSAVGLGKTIYGVRAAETKQAFITGYSEGSFTEALLKELMKLFGTYVFFGGIVPFADVLPDAILAGDRGQFHGLGSAISYVVSSGASRLQELYTAVSNSGLLQGSADFWQNWVNTSYFAEAVNNGLTLPFNDPIGRIFSGTSWEQLPEWTRTFSFDDPVSAANSIGLTMLYGYMGLSGLYATACMNPKAKDFLDKSLPDWFKWAALPGAFLATSAAMMISGVNWYSAPPLVLWAYLIQHRHWVQGGGTYNIFRNGVWKTLPVAKYMTAGAVQLLYIGPGNAIKPHLPSLDAVGLGQYFWNSVEAHCGMVGFLAALGVFHAIFTGLNPIQTLKAKFAKAWTYEIAANVVKLMFGWTSFWGNIFGPALKEVGLGAPVTNVFREAGNSSIQHDMLMGIIGRQRTAMRLSAEAATNESLDGRLLELQQKMIAKAKKIKVDGVDAALKGEAYGFLNVTLYEKGLPDQLIRLTDCYYLEDDRRLLLKPQLERDWYTKIVYRALTDPATPAEKVDEFLERLRVVASDVNPRLKNVRHNLIVAAMRAIAGKAHGERIELFFTEGAGKSIVSAYGLEALLEEARKIKRNEGQSAWMSWLWNSPRRWINKHYMKPPMTPVDEFYNAAAVAGRRFLFSAPFTGRSFVENGSPFTSFILSAMQGDPAFQTTADLSLYAGSLYGLLMAPAKKERMTTTDYRSKVIIPLLDLIEKNAQKLGDNRRDVRHNLLVSVWLASQGPHGEVIREWMDKHKHLYQANGIYGMLKHDERVGRLPRRLNQKKLIKQMFRQFLWDSDNSADGKIVYPLVRSA